MEHIFPYEKNGYSRHRWRHASGSLEQYESQQRRANLCQAYTALIYNGPSFVFNINKKLSALMIDKNIESLEKIQGQSMIKKMY